MRLGIRSTPLLPDHRRQTCERMVVGFVLAFPEPAQRSVGPSRAEIVVRDDLVARGAQVFSQTVQLLHEFIDADALVIGPPVVLADARDRQVTIAPLFSGIVEARDLHDPGIETQAAHTVDTLTDGVSSARLRKPASPGQAG